MPTYVDSASTWEEVVAAYDDNASYDVTGDVEMCKAFIVAARVLLRRLQTVSKNSTAQVEMDPAQVKSQLDAAQNWWRANDTTAPASQYAGGVRGLGVDAWR